MPEISSHSTKITRTQARVDAANNAMKVIMDAKPKTRSTVTTFTSIFSDRDIGKTWPNTSKMLLTLASCATKAPAYLANFPSSSPCGKINSSWHSAKDDSVNVKGGTNAQKGIQFGANVLLSDIAGQTFARD
ncbi:MAG: hypothetical protein RR998_09660 [Oscillospiraceae bacterium]